MVSRLRYFLPAYLLFFRLRVLLLYIHPDDERHTEDSQVLHSIPCRVRWDAVRGKCHAWRMTLIKHSVSISVSRTRPRGFFPQCISAQKQFSEWGESGVRARVKRNFNHDKTSRSRSPTLVAESVQNFIPSIDTPNFTFKQRWMKNKKQWEWKSTQKISITFHTIPISIPPKSSDVKGHRSAYITRRRVWNAREMHPWIDDEATHKRNEPTFSSEGLRNEHNHMGIFRSQAHNGRETWILEASLNHFP